MHLHLADKELAGGKELGASSRGATRRRQCLDVLCRHALHLLCHAPEAALQHLHHQMRVAQPVANTWVTVYFPLANMLVPRIVSDNTDCAW